MTDDLDARQMAAEDLMLGMRMARGVPDEQVEAAAALLPEAAAAFAELEEAGLVVRKRRPLPSHRARLALRQRALRPPVRLGIGNRRTRSSYAVTVKLPHNFPLLFSLSAFGC